MFTALHNLRVDRATTSRDLGAEPPVTMTQQLKDVRAADLPALKAALVAMERVGYPEQQADIADLAPRVKKLAALHEETTTAFQQPKAARRAGIAKEFFDECTGLIETLDRLSARLTRLVKLQDAFVDQLMEIKQLGWVARNAGGDASVMISNALGGLPMPADPMLKFTANSAKVDIVWASLEQVAAGLPLPARFGAAMEKAKQRVLRGGLPRAARPHDEDPGRRPEARNDHAAMDRPDGTEARHAAQRRRGRARHRQGACRDAARERDPLAFDRARAADARAGARRRHDPDGVAPHHQADQCDPGRHAPARRRRYDGRGAVRRPQGRDRQACRRDAGVQGQPRRRGAAARRAARNRGARRDAAQGRDAPARRRIPDHGRQHRQRGVDRLGRAREGRRHADPNRRKHPAAFRHGRVRVRGGIRQRADGRAARPRR